MEGENEDEGKEEAVYGGEEVLKLEVEDDEKEGGKVAGCEMERKMQRKICRMPHRPHQLMFLPAWGAPLDNL